MWLHVPSTLSQSAPVTVESSLDSEKLSLLERSVMWKSNFQPQRSWQNVWKKDTSIRLLSGLTSSPLTQNRGVEKWISSQEAFLVSPSALQDTNSEKTTQETSGQIQPDLLGGLGFQSSFLKMCQESSDTTTTPYDPNYERWVTRLRKDYSQRQKQAHLISVSEFSSWPTPTTAEADKIGNRPNYGQVALSNHPAIMGTPEREKMGKSKKNDGNSTNPDSPSIHQDQETEKHGQDSLQDFLKSSQPFAKTGICSPKCRRLNPNFAEHLMGIPVGWTSVSEPLETELYRQWQHALLSYLRRN